MKTKHSISLLELEPKNKASEKDKLDAIRREFLQRRKEDRPFTPKEIAEISSRLDSFEREINRAW